MANGTHKAMFLSLASLLTGSILMFCAVYSGTHHSPVSVPTYEDTVTQPVPVEVTPDVTEVETVTISVKAPPKRGSVMKLGESRKVTGRCWKQALEQGGSPDAPNVIVCDL